MTTATLEDKVIRAFVQALPDLLPGCKALKLRERPQVGSVVPDLVFRAKVGDTEKTFICEAKPRGEPRYVMEALGLFSLAAKSLPEAYPLFISPTISEEGKALCRKAGVGFITLRGEAFLQFDSVYVDREYGAPSFPTAKARNVAGLLKEAGEPQKIRKLPIPFSPKAARVLRALLENPKESWTVARLANEAHVALRMVSLAVNWLSDKLLVTKERGAIKLAKPKELLDLWAERYKFREMNRAAGYYSPDRNFEEFKDRLRKLPEDQKGRYALTVYGGAALVAPYLRWNVNYVYIKGDVKEWADALELKPVESGANMFLTAPFDDFIFYKTQKKDGITATSNIQLYLDLFNFNDRAREQAEVIYKSKISF
jgi:hypothetical protein